MTQLKIEYVRAMDCYKSPDNVRTQSDPAADAELKVNIAANGGIIENLIGVRHRRGALKGKLEIHGGGRRLDAVHANIADGTFDEDFMVPFLPAISAKDAIEMSLTENFFHLPMNPADECCAFKAIVERENKTPAEVARRFGKTENFVLGRLRLADLADCVFTALRAGEIGIEVAKAYASTPDQHRQARVFEQLGDSYHRHNVNEIRRALAVGTYKGNDPKALLVGREAYEAAGGNIDRDLYSDADTEIWRDGDVLERLVEEKLAEAAEAVREREGFAEVRTIAAASVPYGTTWQLSRLEGEPQPLTPEVEARRAEIEAEIAEIEAAAEEAEDYTEEQSARLEVLEEQLGAVAEADVALTDEQRASAIAYLVIGRDGQPQLHEQLYVEPSSPSAAEDGEDDGADADDGEDALAEEEVEDSAVKISQRLAEELSMQKTELLALHVASDPHFALDLATFFMADAACRTSSYDLPTELRANAPTPRVHDFKGDTVAAQGLSKLDEALDRTWVNHKEIGERFEAFCALEGDQRAAWLGWTIARTLQAVPFGSRGDLFLDHIGQRLGIDVAAWWRPTARLFFDRLTSKGILALFEEVGGLELKSQYAKSRKFDLAVSAEKLFAGQVIVDAEVKDRALRWLPAQMRFGIGPAGTETETGEGEPSAGDGDAGALVPTEEDRDQLPEAA